ncbi:signal peptide peptidase SppA [archaeon]|nr:signal peptide peptidase SppA [archaeon]|tara:strand:- start:2948 stop:3844 length:897 start_codon:yes stop_codon:yes gene_type:complete
MKKPKKRPLTIILLSIILLIFLFIIITKIPQQSQIAVIPINGPILTTSSSFIPTSEALSSTIIYYIEKADKNPSIKGILLEINSPGGTVIASKEIAEAIKKTKKPTIALIKEIGTSGAYWVASASDKIIADPLSITGSIGVIGSYLEFSGLFEKYGITYQQLISGSQKDIGTPYKPLTKEEKALLQQRLDTIHTHFIKEISNNRNIPESRVRELATGIFYLGEQAKALNLVDELGNKDLAIEELKKLANLKKAKLVTYTSQKSFIDKLSKLSSTNFYYLGKGIGSELTKIENKLEITV